MELVLPHVWYLIQELGGIPHVVMDLLLADKLLFKV